MICSQILTWVKVSAMRKVDGYLSPTAMSTWLHALNLLWQGTLRWAWFAPFGGVSTFPAILRAPRASRLFAVTWMIMLWLVMANDRH